MKKIFESPKVIYGTLQLLFPSTENWRKGLAEPPAGTYNLVAYVDNEAAIHLYKKFGFVTEGTHHQFAYRDGVFVDVYAMARLRK